jgi:hypothetical protein
VKKQPPLFLLLAFVVLAAISTAPKAQVNVPPNGSFVWPDALKQGGAQAVAATIVGGKPAVVLSAPTPASVMGRPMTVTASNTFTGRNIASALGRAAGKVVLPVSIATALHSEYCRLEPTGWACDELKDPGPVEGWISSSTRPGCHSASSFTALYNSCRSSFLTNLKQSSGPYTTFTPTTGPNCTLSAGGSTVTCNGEYRETFDVPGDGYQPMIWDRPFGLTAYKTNVTACPPDSDAVGTKCSTGIFRPATPSEVETRIEPALAKDNGLEAAIQALRQAGEDLRAASLPQQISGPQKTTGTPSTTTTTTPDGVTKTETRTPTYTHTYNGNTINTTTTFITVYNDGTVVEEEQPEETPPAVDPSMPPIPTLYEPKYPDGMVGVWNDKKADLQNTGLLTFLNALVPQFGAGGCPVWEMPALVGMHSSQVFNISLPCWVWDALKAIMLVCALIAARRIVFGG